MQPKTAAESADTSIQAHREAELLQAMASAGDLATQRRLAAELQDYRTKRIEAQRHAASLDLSGQIPTSRFSHNPNPANLHTSMASDWMMDVEAPSSTDAERTRNMVAEASLWFTATRPDVKADAEEFAVQAFGMSAHLASQYGEEAAAAQRSFLDHVEHLSGRKLAIDVGQDDVMPDDSTVAGDPAETEPMDTLEAPADTGPAEVDNSTPSGDASLSEGDSPEGDHSGDVAPVPQSATTNNAGDPGDTVPPVDNTPFSDGDVMGAKRRALLQRKASGSTCTACGEQIEQDPKGGWRHKGYQHQKGHQRNHIAAPAEKAAARTVGAKTYQVTMKHAPSGMEHKEMVNADNSATALSFVHQRFPGDSEVATAGEWHVKPMEDKKSAGRVVAVTPDAEDGLNSAVDFDPAANPADSLSLGPGDEGEFPDAPSGDPQTLTNPTVTAEATDPTAGQSCPECGGTGKVPAGGWEDPSQVQGGYVDCPECGGTGGLPPVASAPALASLYDAATNRRLAVATEDHEMAFLANQGRNIFVDGDLMVIASQIAREPYVTKPVRMVYVGMEGPTDPHEEWPADPGPDPCPGSPDGEHHENLLGQCENCGKQMATYADRPEELWR